MLKDPGANTLPGGEDQNAQSAAANNAPEQVSEEGATEGTGPLAD